MLLLSLMLVLVALLLVPCQWEKEVDDGRGEGLLSNRRRFTSTRAPSHVLLLLLLLLSREAAAVAALRALPFWNSRLLSLLLLLQLQGWWSCCRCSCSGILKCGPTVNACREIFSCRGRLAMGEWIGEWAGEGGGAVIIIGSTAPTAALGAAVAIAAAGS